MFFFWKTCCYAPPVDNDNKSDYCFLPSNPINMFYNVLTGGFFCHFPSLFLLLLAILPMETDVETFVQ